METAINNGTLTHESNEIVDLKLGNLHMAVENNSRCLLVPPVIKHEEIEHCSFLDEIKQEPKELSVLGHQITSSSMIKPKWDHCKIESDYTFCDEHNEPEHKLTELAFDFPDKISSSFLDSFSGSKDFSPKEIKSTNWTAIKEIENQSEIVLEEWKIKHEEVDLKEDLEQSKFSTSSDGINKKNYEDYKGHKSNICNYQTSCDIPKDGDFYKCALNEDLLSPTRPKKEFKCDKCEFKTIYRKNLKTHFLVHEDIADVNLLKCCFCEYRTHRKSVFKVHLLRHKSSEGNTFKYIQRDIIPSVVNADLRELVLDKYITEFNEFKCDKCDFKTLYKGYLKRHALRHQNPEDVDKFTCLECEFKTVHRSNLRRHILRHKNPKDLYMFECNKCAFKTPDKGSLKRHAVTHMSLEQVSLWRCDKCEFKTLHKWSLNKHVLRHENRKNVNLFSCDSCEFTTRHKWSLNKHALRHNPKDVDV